MTTKTRPEPRVGYASMDEAATYLGMSTKTLRRHIAQGSLRAYRVGKTKTVRIAWGDLDAMLRPIPTAAA